MRRAPDRCPTVTGTGGHTRTDGRQVNARAIDPVPGADLKEPRGRFAGVEQGKGGAFQRPEERARRRQGLACVDFACDDGDAFGRVQHRALPSR